MGRHYADTRNRDDGPGAAAGQLRSNVSALSAHVRHRLIEEGEMIAAALASHGPERAEKFVAEVLWRGYFKGWLEQRPTVWRAYCRDRDAAIEQLAANAGLRTAYHQAIEGRTGIDCFDAWARELTDTNWLHNHARMWFASIWIFTLRLPWVLGADWFLRHLIDGDAASNTLSWRWVAGLHTRGKHYVARADNIARYTDGRFAPVGLADAPEPLSEEVDYPRQPLRAGGQVPHGRYALVVHDEDCRPESLGLDRPPALLIGLADAATRSPGQVADAVRGFADAAVADALARGQAAYDCPVAAWQRGSALSDILGQHDISAVAMPYLPTGPLADRYRAELAAAGAVELRHPYDAAIWPLATGGFFGVKAKAPAALRALGFAL